MAYAQNFEQRVRDALGQAGGYQWETNWPADKRSRVDVAGLKHRIPDVLVEIELKKDNPVENVVKIWRWASKERRRKGILFIHAFSGHYKRSKVKQYERAVFIGERMAKDPQLRIEYKPLWIHSTTRRGQKILYMPRIRRGSATKQGGGAMYSAASNLAGTITRLLRSRPHRLS